jgi:hypothetical protein
MNSQRTCPQKECPPARSLRVSFKSRMASVFAKKAGWLGVTSGASPLRAVMDVATTPDGLFRENSPRSLVLGFQQCISRVPNTGAFMVLKQALIKATCPLDHWCKPHVFAPRSFAGSHNRNRLPGLFRPVCRKSTVPMNCTLISKLRNRLAGSLRPVCRYHINPSPHWVKIHSARMVHPKTKRPSL